MGGRGRDPVPVSARTGHRSEYESQLHMGTVSFSHWLCGLNWKTQEARIRGGESTPATLHKPSPGRVPQILSPPIGCDPRGVPRCPRPAHSPLTFRLLPTDRFAKERGRGRVRRLEGGECLRFSRPPALPPASLTPHIPVPQRPTSWRDLRTAENRRSGVGS